MKKLLLATIVGVSLYACGPSHESDSPGDISSPSPDSTATVPQNVPDTSATVPVPDSSNVPQPDTTSIPQPLPDTTHTP